VADCVILLEHHVTETVSTRRLRVAKYRGSAHGANEYPFLLGEHGISVLPITSVRLDNEVLADRVSTGVEQLDAMLGGAGYYRGSTVLVSGTAGTGKSSLAAAFAHAGAARGERVLYLALEESPSQIIRNMRSIGIDLQQWVDQGLLRFQASRSTYYGLEMYLVVLHSLIEEFNPRIVIVDPITNFIAVGASFQVKSMLTRLIDMLRAGQITMLFTSLHHSDDASEDANAGISSLIDTWILLRNLESGGERNRALYVLKSRGMAHSNQVREFLLTDQGIELIDVYPGSGTVLTGSARQAEAARERVEAQSRSQELERRRRATERRRQDVQAQIAALTAELQAEEEELELLLSTEEARRKTIAEERTAMTRRRLGSVEVE
jgi:circadian clock protein KaiC